MKYVAVLIDEGPGHLPSFFRPHPGGFDSSRVPTPGNLPSKGQKNANAQGLQGDIQDTYLFTKDRGMKCCKVDISSEQSSMIDVPLNWRTKHGEELVLPREN